MPLMRCNLMREEGVGLSETLAKIEANQRAFARPVGADPLRASP
jgi:hypothetical protein